jgi:hypothetical protein
MSESVKITMKDTKTIIEFDIPAQKDVYDLADLVIDALVRSGIQYTRQSWRRRYPSTQSSNTDTDTS